MMKYLLFFIVSVLVLPTCCFAQDPHFSQYFASPLTINPANTGFFDGDARFAVNERQQWFNVGATYNTTAITADVKLFKERIPLNDVFALGLSGIFEQSLNGALQSNYVSISGAYHKSLAPEGKHMLGLGIQINATNKIINYSKLSFATQFNGKIFDPTIAVDVPYSNNKTFYFDVNAGILYSGHFENINMYTGVSLYHISRPVETLYGANDVVPLRQTLHAGGDITISPTSSIMLSGFYMQQGDSNDYMYGGAYGLKTSAENNEALNLFAGLWYRQNSSFVPYLGAEYKNINLGLNYNIQSDKQFNYTPNTFEISLLFKLKRNYEGNDICPRF
jgi:type IX secretion system PorP/SprF family membrane protein